MKQYNTPHCFEKNRDKKIAMITVYDYTSACIINKTHIDCILVGDSVAMVMYGYDQTLHATLDHMRLHTEAVARGASDKYIVTDLPFMSYRRSSAYTMEAVYMLIQAGAQAVKLEGVEGNHRTIQDIIESGVPVMGHIGLMPQHVHRLGGFKAQGFSDANRMKLLQQAKELDQLGCFAVVLECIPASLAMEITQAISIPTIGIGAGPQTDGQVLVFQDVLGLNHHFQPKFLKSYLKGADLFEASVNQYVIEVQNNVFPTLQHTYG